VTHPSGTVKEDLNSLDVDLTFVSRCSRLPGLFRRN